MTKNQIRSSRKRMANRSHRREPAVDAWGHKKDVIPTASGKEKIPLNRLARKIYKRETGHKYPVMLKPYHRIDVDRK